MEHGGKIKIKKSWRAFTFTHNIRKHSLDTVPYAHGFESVWVSRNSSCVRRTTATLEKG
jgi:hypothetical protein